MEPFAAILFMISCNPGMNVCREQPAPTSFYSDAGECEVAKAFETRFSGENGQVLMARCVPVPESAMGADAEITWYVSRVGNLEVKITPDQPRPQQLASHDNHRG